MVAISVVRPSATLTNNYAATLSFDAAVVPGDDANAVQFAGILDNVTINNTVSSVGPTWTGATITGTNGQFSAVRAGDVISSATGWVSSQTVLSVNTAGSVVTASASNDSVANSGTEAITFTPGAVDCTVYIMRVSQTVSGSSLVLTPKLYTYNGSKVADYATNDGDDNLTIADATAVKVYPSITIDLDAFLTNARVARV